MLNCECGDCAGVSAHKYELCAKKPAVKLSAAAQLRINTNRNKALEIRRKRFALIPRVDLEPSQEHIAPVSNLMHASVATGTTEFRRKFKFGQVNESTARSHTNSATTRHFALVVDPPQSTSGNPSLEAAR